MTRAELQAGHGLNMCSPKQGSAQDSKSMIQAALEQQQRIKQALAEQR